MLAIHPCIFVLPALKNNCLLLEKLIILFAGDAEKMLLCDGCDRGFHMYCLNPPVKKVPEGDWYCADCRPKETKRASRPRKRPAKLEEFVDDIEMEQSVEESDVEASESEEEDTVDNEESGRKQTS